MSGIWSQKPWVGLGNVCTPQDVDLFAAATKVTIGNGNKALFWEASWINGTRPKDIAPSFLTYQNARDVPWLKLWTIIFGFLKSTTTMVYP
jgi:hypothetical protein